LDDGLLCPNSIEADSVGEELVKEKLAEVVMETLNEPEMLERTGMN
jgi:hypothetical protein